MRTIIGVTFRHQGKVYYFDPNGMEIARGESVIVETQQGIEIANVVMGNCEIDDEKITGELKKVKRVADQDDYDQLALNQKNEQSAMKICKEKILEHGLEMKLIRAEYAFDRSKLTFFFTADGRVDFRELVKDLAGIFRTRIELRQVGVRDEARLIGGLGICGRPLCCATWLPDFVPVSIKMAKEQNLSLNSAKISGICGRLMCCLKNEEDTYEYLNATVPNVGAYVKTPEGEHGKVTAVDVLRQKVTLVLNEDNDEKEVREYSASELTFTKGRKGKDGKEKNPVLPDELKNAENAEGGSEKPEREQKQRDRQPRENRENRDGQKRENRERRDNRERQNGENREGRENQNHERRDNRERQPRENRDGQKRDGQNRENRERQPRENREAREKREPRDGQNRDGQNREKRERQPRESRENRMNTEREAVNQAETGKEAPAEQIMTESAAHQIPVEKPTADTAEGQE